MMFTSSFLYEMLVLARSSRGRGSGSPLDARSNPTWLIVIGIALVAIGVIAVIRVIITYIKNYQKSPAYIEHEKRRSTKKRDITALAQKINLTKDEALLLFSICKHTNARNIYYSWTDHDFVDSIFKNEYDRMKALGMSEKLILDFFNLRNRLEKAVLAKENIPSSHNIHVGDVLLYESADGVRYQLKVLKNDPDAITVRVPDEFYNSPLCPAQLSRITLRYISPQRIQYKITTRVIRYQGGAGNSIEMVVSHSTAASMEKRRTYKRVNIGLPCIFRGVKEAKNSRGAIAYIPKENKYEGKLVDISAGGCKILTTLPIKSDQKIWMEIQLSGREAIEACGLIVGVQKNVKSNLYALHISFLKIPGKSRNDIFSFIYNYA